MNIMNFSNDGELPGAGPDEDLRPLVGVRVLDLSWVLAGPVTGRLLADAGADVIKVESRKRIDNTRRGKAVPVASGVDEASSDPVDRVPLFHNLNAGKKSIALDLGTAEGLDVLRRLLAQTDIVLDNFAPGVMQRLGLGRQTLLDDFPRLIAISLSGTGQQGPLADIPAYAPTVTSLAGLEDLVGYPEDGGAAMGILGLNLADSWAGLVGFYAVLSALWAQRMTGKGQFIDFSEMEGICTMMATPLIDYEMNGRVMQASGNAAPLGAPYGIFPAAGVDQWISLAVVSEHEWQAFCAVEPEAPWVSDPAYASAAARVAAKTRLEEQIAAYTRQHEAVALVARLQEGGVAAGLVHDYAGQLADGHLRDRELFREIDVPDVGKHLIYGSPWRLTATPTQSRGAAPRLGEHTRAVLAERLGMDDAEYQRLADAGVFT